MIGQWQGQALYVCVTIGCDRGGGVIGRGVLLMIGCILLE